MPIYRRNQKIASVYRGLNKIASIYRGNRQTFSSSKGKRVPLFDKYYKGKYVLAKSSTKNCSFNNAIVDFDPTLRKYEIVYEGNIPLYIYKQSVGTTRIGLSLMMLGKSQNDLSLPTTGQHKIVVDKDKLYLDNAYVQDLIIGNRLDSITAHDIRLNYAGKFFEMKIYQNDVLVFHFVPAYYLIQEREIYGIAELVNKVFSGSSSLIGEAEYE